MIKTAYLDCFSGVSGNMLLGALLAAGLPEEVFHSTVQALKISGYELTIQKEVHCGLQATVVKVKVSDKQTRRHLKDIQAILENSSLSKTVIEKSKAVFLRLAMAEAAVHGSTVDEVHFHEVGAVDALIDVVGTVAGLEYLGIHTLVSSPLPMPRGWVQCAHGQLPLPAPAVCQLLKDVPVYGESLEQELVTPTGAAIVTELAAGFGIMPVMQLQDTGYGAGTMKRKDGRPNLLRIITGIPLSVEETQQVAVLESNLDDWNPEGWPHVSSRFMKSGALDVSLIPMHMKKGRPGYLLRVVCDPAHMMLMRKLIFTETSAIGLRFRKEQRMTLPRRAITVQTRFGAVQAKEIDTDRGLVVTPEYEDCSQVASKQNVSIQEVYQEVCREVLLQSERQKVSSKHSRSG